MVAPLGAGGMGEVYRAHDARLGRDVAIKILPHAFTTDPERLARFEREARVLAALNHPHIAGIHGIEEAGEGAGARPGAGGGTRRSRTGSQRAASPWRKRSRSDVKSPMRSRPRTTKASSIAISSRPTSR